MTKFKVSAQLKKRQAGDMICGIWALTSAIGHDGVMHMLCMIMLLEVEVTWSKNVDREAGHRADSAL